MTICLLETPYPWLSSRGSFALLPDALRLNGCHTRVTAPRNGLAVRAVGKVYSMLRRHPPRDQHAAVSEGEFLLRLLLSGMPGHVLNLEDHLEYLSPPSGRIRWIGTIHQPRKKWTEDGVERLRRLPGVIVLCDAMRDDFSDVIDKSRIVVLPHGVDASFFRPGEETERRSNPRVVFVGAWLRNTAMLTRIIPEVLRLFPSVRFDLVVPLHARNDRSLTSLREAPAINWHHGVSDEKLRSLYQEATALILPMEDSGANNTVLEALACGLPIATTDVGGIRSYGGGSIFPLVRNNDDSGFLDLIATYLTDEKFRLSVSRSSRKFAEAKLDWPVAAKDYIAAYHSLGYL